MTAQKSIKDRVIFILYNLTIVFVFLAISEGVIRYWLHNPKVIPAGMRTAFRSYYDEHLRSTIQMEPTCAVYDTGLFYTLRPGKCTFENLEFKVDLNVNRVGVRDDDNSLHNPEVIFLGDSFTMGWGIPQDSTYEALASKSLGKTVLNAGISSYGTVRELELLKRINRDSLKTIVIQYHYSDLMENREFVEHHDSLKISTPEKYKQTSDMVRKRNEYFFGKHTSLLTKFLLKNMTGRIEARPSTGKEDVKYFLHVLTSLGEPIHDKNIVVFEIASHGEKGNTFLAELKKEIANEKYPAFIRNIKIVDVQPILTEQDYFILDDHFITKGHIKVSQELVKAIQSF
jgi:hypothetical protein